MESILKLTLFSLVFYFTLQSCSSIKIKNDDSDMRNKTKINGKLVEVNFGNRLCKHPDFKDSRIPELQATHTIERLNDPIFKAAIQYEIPLIKFQYNSSIVRIDDSGYLMTVRFDCTNRSNQNTQSYTLVHELNNELTPVSDLQFLKIPSFLDAKIENGIAEDMRLFKIKDQIYGTIGDNLDGRNYYFPDRRIHLLKISTEMGEWKAKSIEFFSSPKDSPIKGPEKNWAPIPIFTSSDSESPLLVYALDPQYMLAKATPNKTIQGEREIEIVKPCNRTLPWDRAQYGKLRGGTPLIWLNELQGYLGFFHTAKHLENERGNIYYMGAYVVNGTTKCVSHISPAPLQYTGMYDAKEEEKGFWIHNAGPDTEVIFPTGVEISVWEGQQVIIVSAGINDYRVKNFILDRQALTESLSKITP